MEKILLNFVREKKNHWTGRARNAKENIRDKERRILSSVSTWISAFCGGLRIPRLSGICKCQTPSQADKATNGQTPGIEFGALKRDIWWQ